MEAEKGKATTDVMTRAIISGLLQNISEQMGETVRKTACSSVIQEIRDFCAAICDREGRLVVHSELGLPRHGVGASHKVMGAINRWGNDFSPGDIILENDPFTCGTAHLPDWTFISPIFIDNELTFFAMCLGHQMDTSGAYPGGYFPGGYDIHAEGLMIPAEKIYIRGERQTIYDFILHNVRWPEVVELDNMAMMGVLKLAERGLIDLCKRYGKDTVLSVIHTGWEESERAVRAEIAQWPDGTYYGESGVETDGMGHYEVMCRVKLTIKRDEITVDMSDSDKRRVSLVNCPYEGTEGSVFCAIWPALETTIIKNYGAMQPIKTIAPKGSVVNPVYPATVGGAAVFGAVIIDAVQMALGQVLPDKVAAGWARMFIPVIFGDDPRTGETYWMASFESEGGGGATHGVDGCPAIAPIVTGGTVYKIPVELVEIQWPWQILKYEMVTDSGGAGEDRGGLGIHWMAVNKHEDSQYAGGAMYGDGAWPSKKFPPFGQGDAKPLEMVNKFYKIKKDGTEEILRSMDIGWIYKDEIVGTITAGGGAAGHPYKRPIDKVKDDVLNGYVSVKSARDDYGVVIDPETLEVDYEETKKIRG